MNFHGIDWFLVDRSIFWKLHIIRFYKIFLLSFGTPEKSLLLYCKNVLEKIIFNLPFVAYSMKSTGDRILGYAFMINKTQINWEFFCIHAFFCFSNCHDTRGQFQGNERIFPKGPVVRGLDPDFFIPLFKSLFAIISLFFLEHPIIWTKELYWIFFQSFQILDQLSH